MLQMLIQLFMRPNQSDDEELVSLEDELSSLLICHRCWERA